MPFALFHERFPVVAEQETRTLRMVAQDGSQSPEIAFLEMFCS